MSADRLTYDKAAREFAKRRKGNDYKRLTHNQVLKYDRTSDSYLHVHHRTCTVEIFRDKYRIDTGGWGTKTTWEKIRDVCPVFRCWAASHVSPSINCGKVVVWGGGVTPFYDGFEIDYYGTPLVQKPVPVRRRIRGACVEFDKMAGRIRRAVLPATLFGVYDETNAIGKDGRDLLQFVYELNDHLERTGQQFLHPDYVSALFATRKQCSFGRERWSQPDFVPAQTRLASNLAAAKQAWISQHWKAVYEIVEMPCETWPNGRRA